jgi:putative SOS response-associated peptidase YedK
MCGRMTLGADEEVLALRFHVDVTGDLVKRYNVYPNHDKYKLPVITEEDPDKISMFYWGLLPVWWKRDQRGLINVKYETLRDKKTFHKDLTERRCLVLADGFYEWKGERGHKTPYYIHLKTGEPFAFAGVFETNKVDGTELQNFAIITTAPNELMQPIHNRMPVILNRDAEASWLNPDTSPEDALDILADPLSAAEMEAYPVAPNVNRPTYDRPEARERVGIA